MVQANGTVDPASEGASLEGGAQPAGGAAPDMAAEVERLKGEVAGWEQRYKSLQGKQQVRVDGPNVVAQLQAIQAEQRRMRRQLLETQDIDEPTRQNEIAKLSAEEEAAVFVRASTKIANRIAKALGTAGIGNDHPRVLEANQKWVSAQTLEEREAVEDELVDFINDERDSKTKAEIEAERKKVQEAERRFNQENGTLDVAVDRGTPGGSASLSSYVQRLKKGEKLPTAEEIDRLTAGYLR